MTDTQKKETTKHVMSAQWMNLGIVTGVVLCALIGFIFLMSDHTTDHSNNEKANFSGALEHVDAESVLLEKTQQQLHDTEKKTESLQQQVDVLSNKSKEEQQKSNVTEELQKRIAVLENKLQQNQNSSPSSSLMSGMESSSQYQGHLLPLPLESKAASLADMNAKIEQSIHEDTLSLPPSDMGLSDTPLKNPDTYVPAGTFVKAVMIGGADASAAVNASSDPLVMLFRITENGTLPNHKKSHLKDCMALTSVWGDISSERGQIRLVNLSCTFPNGEIVDQPVEGTVFGPEGKNGVRGTPVWREGALLQRAFVAGTLSGLSDGLSQTYTTNSISAEGNVQTINPGRIFQYGAAKGAGKAMDKLADYNIQRAEQYHPVIQLSAGTVVDIVFQKGFFLDGKQHDNKDTSVGNYRNPSTNTPMLFPQSASSEPNLPLSNDQVRRIQEKSKELGLRVTPQANGF